MCICKFILIEYYVSLNKICQQQYFFIHNSIQIEIFITCKYFRVHFRLNALLNLFKYNGLGTPSIELKDIKCMS